MTLDQIVAAEFTAKERESIADLIDLLKELTQNVLDFPYKISNGGGSSTIGDDGIANITLPIVMPNMPVGFVDNKLAFAYVDRKAMLVHELSHIALQLMGLDSELNNARLAAAISSAGDFTNIAAIKQNLSPTSAISPNASNASFENVFNDTRHYYSTLTGTQEGNLYRTGYYSKNRGQVFNLHFLGYTNRAINK